MFWTGAPVGLAIMARVDGDEGGSKGLVYPLLGKGHQNLTNIGYPAYLGASYDASTTNLTYNIDGGRGENSTIVLSFLSPITPTSTFRQSLPAAYINIHVSGGLELSVYIDIDGRWATGDADPVIHWGFHQDDLPTDEGILPLKTFYFYNGAGKKLFTEQNDRAEWGEVSFIGPRDVEHCAGTDTEVRSRFAETAHAGGHESCKTGSERNEVLAFSKNFSLGDGGKSDTTIDDSVLFTIGHVQDPIVQFAAARGLTMMRPLWASWFEDAQSMVTYHYLDFQNAFALAANYSEQFEKDAKEEGPDGYADILALSARQVMGATSFSGTPEDPLLFLKEISSNGDMQTVDVIFPAFPFFLYTNPRWLAYLLEPLIEHQLSGQYPNDYSLHDIGVFPNGTGHADGGDEYMPVEECGNMLIMSLALANSLKETKETGSPWAAMGQPDHDFFDGGSLFPLGLARKPGMDSAWVDAKSGEKAKEWLSRTHKLLKQWTGYLVRETLIPANQLSTDDFAGWLANQTNLALKGIIGIRAMSDVSSILGFEEDAEKYRNISETYADKWLEYAISRDGTHVKVAYTWYGSWATTYNLFADSLLCFHLDEDDSKTDGKTKDVKQQPLKDIRTSKANRKLIPDKVYDMQSTQYHNVMQRYGLPLDSRHLYTKSDWQLFAASVASTSVRDEIITAVARWVNETVSDGPFPDLYETEGKGEFGAGNRFRARPVVGGHFAGVSLARSCGGRVREGMKGSEPHGKGGKGTKEGEGQGGCQE